MDAAPDLYADISARVIRSVSADPEINGILTRIAKGTATHLDTDRYALKLGKLVSKSLLDVLTAGNLPDGTLYYNIAERTVLPALKDSHKMVNDIAVQIQNLLLKNAGLGIKAKTADLDASRIEDLVSAMANSAELDTARDLMGESVINTVQSYADDFIQTNADFQRSVGMRPRIIRTSVAGCCEWCENLAGTYDYPLQNKDVYRRHKFCRCTVTYDPGTGRVQNVHTEKWTTDPKLIEARKKIGK